MLTLDTNIQNIYGVGKTIAARLKRLGIETARDLLFYFPFRYDDFSQLTPINKLQPNTKSNIVGQVELIHNRRSSRKRMFITEAIVTDETDTIKVVWFNQPFIAKNLKAGDTVSLAGKIDGDFGHMVMKSPSYEKAGGLGAIHTQGLVPNYNLTANITQKQIRFLTKQVIELTEQITDWLPKKIVAKLKLLPLGRAIAKIHFPENQEGIEAARRRLSFNELFIIQLQNQLIKERFKSIKARPTPFLEKETKKFVDSLPFKLTSAQRKAAWEILQDITKDRPMARLLEGDVGSGKTVVAAMAMLNAALNKKQAVLMVPTEILAQQHYASLCELLRATNIPIALFTRSARRVNTRTRKHENTKTREHENTKTREHENTKTKNIGKKKMVEMIKDGEVNIIIGTHALIQENVEFKNLALAVVDEQHRFGVEQRKALIKKSGVKLKATRRRVAFNLTPHLLTMTATPIPRSLAMALYGDLDISVIDEMPEGRKAIPTYVVPENKREQAYNFIRQQVKAGRQVFVICPLIDISDKLGVKSVKQEFKKLDKKIFPDLAISMLHGRMKGGEKEQIMRDFLDNKIKVLVATSVVEVGVDVPNATIMMIEGAERFGLAQLHQFRGRVGRSDHQSYCFLFTDSDAEKSMKRLNTMTKYHDGFTLAKMDLKFRGPGQVYGTMQKGFPELKVASLFDYGLMKLAKDEAIKLIEKDKALASWPDLKERLGLEEKIGYLAG